MERESTESQLHKLRAQIDELRHAIDQAISRPEATWKARGAMERAQHRMMAMGKAVTRNKGMFISIGTVLLLLFSTAAFLMMFPDIGTKAKHMLREKWDEYTHPTEYFRE